MQLTYYPTGFIEYEEGNEHFPIYAKDVTNARVPYLNKISDSLKDYFLSEVSKYSGLDWVEHAFNREFGPGKKPGAIWLVRYPAGQESDTSLHYDYDSFFFTAVVPLQEDTATSGLKISTFDLDQFEFTDARSAVIFPCNRKHEVEVKIRSRHRETLVYVF